MHHPTDRIAHTTAFVTPVVEHWLEREIAQWVHHMKDRSDDPSHHERTPLPRASLNEIKYNNNNNNNTNNKNNDDDDNDDDDDDNLILKFDFRPYKHFCWTRLCARSTHCKHEIDVSLSCSIFRYRTFHAGLRAVRRVKTGRVLVPLCVSGGRRPGNSYDKLRSAGVSNAAHTAFFSCSRVCVARQRRATRVERSYPASWD